MVSLYGVADAQDTREKAILLAGNVKGVAAVNDDYFTIKAVEEETTYYVVQPGDNLSKIAKQTIGDANKYNAIFEANREVIKDPNKIKPGMMIKVPVEK